MARETYPSKVTFFPELEDGSFDEAVKLPWCVKLNVKFNKATKEYKADGRVEKSTTKIESADIELEVSSDLPLEVESKLDGSTYNKGMQITSTTTLPVKGALAYEIAMDDGTCRRRCLHGVTLSKDELNNETESDGETFTYSGKGIGDAAGDIKFDLDEKEVTKGADPKIKAIWDNFFTEPAKRPVEA